MKKFFMTLYENLLRLISKSEAFCYISYSFFTRSFLGRTLYYIIIIMLLTWFFYYIIGVFRYAHYDYIGHQEKFEIYFNSCLLSRGFL
jgi:hypothetical protein